MVDGLIGSARVYDRLGRGIGIDFGSTGDPSREDEPGDVIGDAAERADSDISESSRNLIDEAEEEEVAERSSGASKASMLVVEISCIGAEIFPRLMVPALNLTCPSW